MTALLPTSREEMAARGYRELDILLITGDAYFDHPSHGVAVIGRVLENAGYRVGIVARPDWRNLDDFTRMGRPALFAGVSAGAVDSSLNNYTADLRKRRDDAYAPGGKGGGRPDYATLVYANKLKEAFPGLPIVLGGIEASTRRYAFFDGRTGKLRRSVLVDSRADILVYGHGERAALQIAERVGRGETLEQIPGTCVLYSPSRSASISEGDLVLPEFESVRENPERMLKHVEQTELAGRPSFAGRVIETYQEGTVVCEPSEDMSSEELDGLYELPYAREAHPSYLEPIPAFEMIRWSVTSHRGCPGGCSFCALSMHQGREVVPRSEASVLEEVEKLASRKAFKGTITDVGGPTANAYGATRIDLEKCSKCRRPSCFYPSICSNIRTDHKPLLRLLEKVRGVAGVKHVFLASGIRHDLAARDKEFVRAVARHYTGGHLKLAPEHVSPKVLMQMRKPSIEIFEQFEKMFLEESARAGKKQYIVPYFIAGFPACLPKDAEMVQAWLAKRRQRLQQVQIYMPLPGTAAAVWWALRKDRKKQSIFVADQKERRRQKELLTLPIRKKKRWK